MENNALVILWKGKSIPDSVVNQLAMVLIDNNICVPELLTIKFLNEKDLTNVLVKSVEIKHIDANTTEAIKQAVVYIGTRFENSINKGIGVFAIELYTAVNMAKMNKSDEDLLTAVEIISTKSGIIPQVLSRKYHFSNETVNVIKKVYNS